MKPAVVLNERRAAVGDSAVCSVLCAVCCDRLVCISVLQSVGRSENRTIQFLFMFLFWYDRPDDDRYARSKLAARQ